LFFLQKLRQRQETNKEKFTSLNAILQDEKDNDSSTEGQAGALWLTRYTFKFSVSALLFVYHQLQLFSSYIVTTRLIAGRQP